MAQPTELLDNLKGVLSDSQLSDTVKSQVLTILSDHDRATSDRIAEERNRRWNTPLAVALTGLITLGGNFFFDYFRGKSETENAVTLAQLQATIKDASDRASRENEVQLAKLKSEIDQQTAEHASDKSLEFEEKQFQFKIVERTLTEQSSETERAKVLLFLVRSGVLNNLDAKELRSMATETLARSEGTLARTQGTGFSVGVPSIAHLGEEAKELRPLSPLTFDLIASFEGFYPTPTNDKSGYCTIGYGHLISSSPCREGIIAQFANGISKEEAFQLLEKDTEMPRRVIERLVSVDLTDDQFGALTSFVLNVGQSHFSASSLLRLLNSGKYELVAEELLRWTRSRGHVLPNLTLRRSCEASLFLGKKLYDDTGKFDSALCEPSPAAPSVDELDEDGR